MGLSGLMIWKPVMLAPPEKTLSRLMLEKPWEQRAELAGSGAKESLVAKKSIFKNYLSLSIMSLFVLITALTCVMILRELSDFMDESVAFLCSALHHTEQSFYCVVCWTVSCCELSPGWRGCSGILCCFFPRSPPTSRGRETHGESHIHLNALRTFREAEIQKWQKTFNFITNTHTHRERERAVGRKKGGKKERDILKLHLQGQEGACGHICIFVCFLYETHTERGATVMTVLVPFH